MDVLTLCGVFLAVILSLIYWIMIHRKKQPYNFPPGPRGLPLIGNVLDFSPATAHFTFTKLSKQYGDLFTLNLAGQKAVVLNSSEVLRDAFVSEDTRDAFAGKPSNFYAKYCRGHRQTSFMTYTDVCKMQRQLFLRNLKMYDTGRHCHEGMVSDQLALVVQTLRDIGRDSFDLHGTLVTTLANTILILISGKRYDLDDPMLKTILAFVDINNQMLNGHMLTILTALPFLRHLPFGYGKIFQEYNRLNSKFDEYTFDHFKKSYDPSRNRGLIDSLLGLQNDNPWLKDENIKAILSETMSAGLLTSRAALVSFFLIILHRPEVMQKIQKEIDEVVGSERRPTLADKKQMPYTEAAITEAVRYFGGPFGIPHLTMKDVWLRGFFLPKDTFVIVNFWAMRYDEKVWDDPREYRPERFLDEDGNLLPIDSLPRRSFVGFGGGQRSCVGETFARSRLFLCITTLLQEFDFRPSKTEPLPSYDPGSFEFGIQPEPPPYKACALPRNNI